jgi:hypothetical protein
VWTHVAVVQSRASLTDTYGPAQIYWNGASVATTSSMRFPLPVSRSNLYVGKSNWAGEGTFTGQMKDLLVWDVALSPAELDGVRLGGGLPSTPAPLVSMMRTWCGAAPPPSPPLLPPPSRPPPPPPPLCAVDGAYTFTGAATSYLTATSRTGLVGGGLGFTLCAWVYRTRTGDAGDRVLDFGNDAYADNIVVEFSYKMLFDVYHGSAPDRLTPSSASSFPANVWTHVAVVQSRASLTATYGPAQIYWNGVSVATTASFRFPLPVSRSNLYVGKSNWGSYHPMFTGQMKDLLVWDVALSPAQLDGVRLGGGLPSTPAPLISMMRTWCGAAPPPSPPPSPPPPSPPYPPYPPPSPPPPPYLPGTAVVSTVSSLTSALANTAVGRIVLASGTYYLSATLSITRSVVVEAAVAGSVVLDAQASSLSQRRVLYINPGSLGVVQLIGFNITGGHAQGVRVAEDL